MPWRALDPACLSQTVLRFLIREWLLRPERDVAVIRDRHDTVEAFLAPDSVALVDSLRAAVRHIRFMPVRATK